MPCVKLGWIYQHITGPASHLVFFKPKNFIEHPIFHFISLDTQKDLVVCQKKLDHFFTFHLFCLIIS